MTAAWPTRTMRTSQTSDRSPSRVTILRPLPRPVDVFDEEVHISAGKDEQRHGVDHLGACRARAGQLVVTAPL